MKTKSILIVIVLAFAFGNSSFAQEKNYKDGSVWTMSFIKVNYGQGVDYINSLKNTWKAVQDEAIKEGLVLSYKILDGESSTPEDYNMILMVEFKNLAAMEGNEAKWDAIQAKVVGNEENQKKLMGSRVNMRSMYGQKVMREIVYK